MVFSGLHHTGVALQKFRAIIADGKTREMSEDIAMLYTNKDLKKLIIPLVFEQLLAILVGMVDTVMIAGVGVAAGAFFLMAVNCGDDSLFGGAQADASGDLRAGRAGGHGKCIYILGYYGNFNLSACRL